jgi:hypothetical protein
MARKAYQITNSGIEAIGSGQVLFGEGKLDHIDIKILKVLSGEETFDQSIAEQIEKRIPRLERKGYVMLVNI